jgi:hypothetical protein
VKSRGITVATKLDAWPETYRQQIHDVFYIVIGPRGLKLGISSGDGSQRLAEHRRNGYVQTARLWAGLPGRVADDTEDLASIHRVNWVSFGRVNAKGAL